MELSIIIPTYNEGENVLYITEVIQKTLENKEYEILFVDDSQDDTVEVLRLLALQNNRVKVYHRENERGLATAVIWGLRQAKGAVLAVMDADMQHPPELIHIMLEKIYEGAEIVLPSRFVPGGSDGGLNLRRKFISWSARMLGKLCIKRLRGYTDITGGYFMLRREVVDGISLSPIGWKILMEILVRGNYSKVVEVPYTFQARDVGYSKMSFKEQQNYLRHLWRLMQVDQGDLRFLKFALVGGVGTFVNLIVYMMAVKLGYKVVVAGLLSAFVAMIGNFLMNNYFTWKERTTPKNGYRFIRYVLLNASGIGWNLVLLHIFYHFLNAHYILANVIAIGIVMLWNYFWSNRWVFK